MDTFRAAASLEAVQSPYNLFEPLNRLGADVEAGWQQVEEGKVKEFDPKRRGREKLAHLRKAKW
jgi:hypothetical protein